MKCRAECEFSGVMYGDIYSFPEGADYRVGSESLLRIQTILLTQSNDFTHILGLALNKPDF